MIETPEQFQKWRKCHGFTQGEAAERLGVSKRSIVTFESTGPVTRTAALACSAISHDAWSREFLDRLIREQYPSLSKDIFVLDYVITKHPTYSEMIDFALAKNVKDWADTNAPSAQIKLLTLMTPEMNRWEVAIVTFGSEKDAMIFNLRWR